MPARDPTFARKKILEHFRAPPRLTFDHLGFSELTYEFPKLERPGEFYNEPSTGDAPETSVGAERPQSLLEPVQRNKNAIFPTSLIHLNECLSHATSKFEYGRTSAVDWNDYFRFASDQVICTSDRRYTIEATSGFLGRYINATRQRATQWFQDELVPTVKSTRGRIRTFVLGDPGSGKSTLLKFLINTNWDYIRQQKIIFSRFEFMKFFVFWHEQQPNLSIEEKLDDYISFILLRDIIYFTTYRLSDGNHYVRQDDLGAFSTRRINRTIKESLDKFEDLETYAEYNDSEEGDDDHASRLGPSERLAKKLSKAVTEDHVDHDILRQVKPNARLAIIHNFKSRYNFAIILDGLDHIAMEDACFETRRAAVLRHIDKNLDRIGNFQTYTPGGIGLNPNLVLVMRENTFYTYHRGVFGDVNLYQDHVYRVAKISARAAILNVIRRAVRHWRTNCGGPPSSEKDLADLLMSAVDATMRIINRSAGAGSEPDLIYGIFCGNFRNLFDFIRKLLAWFVKESLQQGVLVTSPDPTLDDILRAMTGPGGLRVLMRRKYRIFEILLFSRLPWFENAIISQQPSVLLTRFRGTVSSEKNIFQDNAYHNGFVDNVLNYHVVKHRNNNNQHCLLEKVRIIQILMEVEVEEEKLRELLLRRFGYESESLLDSLLILIRTQLICANVRPQDKVYLSATERGKFVVKYLCNNMSYLEHVFHQTLLPGILTGSVEDKRRDSGVEDWTVNSIRNTFTLLTYLKFVEDNAARGRKVSERYRLFDRASERVSRSIRSILLLLDDEEHRRRPEVRAKREEILASRALRLIENQIKLWDQRHLIA